MTKNKEMDIKTTNVWPVNENKEKQEKSNECPLWCREKKTTRN